MHKFGEESRVSGTLPSAKLHVSALLVACYWQACFQLIQQSTTAEDTSEAAIEATMDPFSSEGGEVLPGAQ